MADTLISGRDALRRHDWEAAFQAFAEADSSESLAPEDLEAMADAAWWSGRPDEASECLERAYAGYVRDHRNAEAAMVALLLSERGFRSLSLPLAQGWMGQAERLLEDEPESRAHAWLAFLQTARSLMVEGDSQASIEKADRAIEIGRRHQDEDVVAISTSFKGAALVRLGRLDEGLALIDRAAAAATSGVLSPKIACDVYCNTIASCRDTADYRRAAEWTDRVERWMRRQGINGYPGVCRVHRAELKRLRGRWPEAEEEARHACDELERFRMLYGVGFAYREVAEVRRRMGDMAAADEAFLKAYEFGMDPQPGLALYMLAKGDADEAAAAISRLLETSSGEEWRDFVLRVDLLPAQVEIALARGDLDTARAATEELEEIVRGHDKPPWTAAALTVRGSLDLAEGRAEQAIAGLDRAWRIYAQEELPYESARARILLGQARAATGDAVKARMEWHAAASTLRQLGAAPDLRRLEELSRAGDGGGDERERVTRSFMFTDIVTSTDLIGLIGDAAWEKLLHWHDRALRTEFERFQGEVVRHTGDGFFVTFDDARQAIECAVEIQRSLARHRQEHGFAPWVRIGIHTAEATRQGGDYAGQGVHAAARVGALGEREEIVVSAASLEEAGSERFPHSDSRSVTLKGIGEPIEVCTIEWR